MSGGDYDATYGVEYDVADGVGIWWIRVCSCDAYRSQYGCTKVKYDLTDEVEDGRLESAWGQLGQETLHMNTVCNRQMGPYHHQQNKIWSKFGLDKKLKKDTTTKEIPLSRSHQFVT